MPRPAKAKPTSSPSKTKAKDSSANLGFEAKLWSAADSRSAAKTAEGNVRNDMDAAEYKHVVLGLIFLSRAKRDRLAEQPARRASAVARGNYISDSFEEHHAKLVAGKGEYAGGESGGPGRVQGGKHLLGAAGGAVEVSAGQREAADDERADKVCGNEFGHPQFKRTSTEARRHPRNLFSDLGPINLLANPFNDSNWRRKDEDAYWQFKERLQNLGFDGNA